MDLAGNLWMQLIDWERLNPLIQAQINWKSFVWKNGPSSDFWRRIPRTKPKADATRNIFCSTTEAAENQLTGVERTLHPSRPSKAICRYSWWNPSGVKRNNGVFIGLHYSVIPAQKFSLFHYSCSKIFVIPLFLLKNFHYSIIPPKIAQLFHQFKNKILPCRTDPGRANHDFSWSSEPGQWRM